MCTFFLTAFLKKADEFVEHCMANEEAMGLIAAQAQFVIPVLLRLQLQSSTSYLHLHIYSHSSYLLHIYYTIIAIVHNLTDNRKYTIFDQKVFNTMHYKFLHV